MWQRTPQWYNAPGKCTYQMNTNKYQDRRMFTNISTFFTFGFEILFINKLWRKKRQKVLFNGHIFDNKSLVNSCVYVNRHSLSLICSFEPYLEFQSTFPTLNVYHFFIKEWWTNLAYRHWQKLIIFILNFICLRERGKGNWVGNWGKVKTRDLKRNRLNH